MARLTICTFAFYLSLFITLICELSMSWCPVCLLVFAPDYSVLQSCSPLQASGRLSAASRQGSVASTTGGDSAANGDAVPGASPRKAGQAGVKDLGTEQRELLARAIDTAILKASSIGSCSLSQWRGHVLADMHPTLCSNSLESGWDLRCRQCWRPATPGHC